MCTVLIVTLHLVLQALRNRVTAFQLGQIEMLYVLEGRSSVSAFAWVLREQNSGYEAISGKSTQITARKPKFLAGFMKNERCSD